MTKRDLHKAKTLVDQLMNIYRSGIIKGSESEQRLIAGIADLVADEREQCVLICKLAPMTTPYNVGLGIEYAAEHD